MKPHLTFDRLSRQWICRGPIHAAGGHTMWEAYRFWVEITPAHITRLEQTQIAAAAVEGVRRARRFS